MCRLGGNRIAGWPQYRDSALGEQKAKLISERTKFVYTVIVRNITFSADEEVIEAAREVARRNQRSLNDEFRDWLARYAGSESKEKVSIPDLLEQLKHVKVDRKYTREEMNERR